MRKLPVSEPISPVVVANKKLFPKAYPGDRIERVPNRSGMDFFVWEVDELGMELRDYTGKGQFITFRAARITHEQFAREWIVVSPNPMYPNGKYVELDPDFLEAISDERKEWLMTSRRVEA